MLLINCSESEVWKAADDPGLMSGCLRWANGTGKSARWCEHETQFRTRCPPLPPPGPHRVLNTSREHGARRHPPLHPLDQRYVPRALKDGLVDGMCQVTARLRLTCADRPTHCHEGWPDALPSTFRRLEYCGLVVEADEPTHDDHDTVRFRLLWKV